MDDNGFFIKKLFNKYAVPTVITLFGSISGSVINSAMAGNYFGGTGLAAIGICAPLMYLFCTIGALIGIGAANCATRLVGKDDYDSINSLYGTSFTATVLVGIIVSLGGLLFMESITGILSDGTELRQAVYRYFMAYIPFGVFVMLQYTLVHFARINGKPNVGMYMFAVMIVLNVIFNYIFAAVLGFGVESIALGAGIAAIGTDIAGLVLLNLKKDNLKLGKPQILFLPKIAVAGSPSALSNLFMLLRAFIFNGLLMSLGGENPVAVFSVISSVTAIATAAMYGIGQTITPIVGILNEEKDNASIRQIIKRAFFVGGVITVVFSLCVGLLSKPLFALYGISNPAIQSILRTALLYLAASLIFYLINVLFTYYYTAIARFWIANVLTFMREFLLPIVFAYSLSGLYGVDGVWLSLLLVEIVAILVVFGCSALTTLKDANASMLFMFDKRLEKEGRYISFSVDNNSKDIAEASEKIVDFCEKNRLSQKQSMLISMSIEEIITLIAANGINKESYNAVAVRVFILSDVIILRIRNIGKRFNPIDYYNETISVDIEKSLEVIGLKYIVGASKAIHYRETFGVNNLTVVL